MPSLEIARAPGVGEEKLRKLEGVSQVEDVSPVSATSSFVLSSKLAVTTNISAVPLVPVNVPELPTTPEMFRLRIEVLDEVICTEIDDSRPPNVPVIATVPNAVGNRPRHAAFKQGSDVKSAFSVLDEANDTRL
jgi:hypothetical protein